MKKLLSLNSISAGYNSEIIIKDITFDVYENDFTAIVGPNGCGKTTLLKIILKTKTPFSGEIIFQNSINVGYLPQINKIDKHFPISVETVVLSGLLSQKKLFHKFKKSDYQKVKNVLVTLDALHLQYKNIGELSGGQAQRVFLARALISNPTLLVLDEPDTYIDHSMKSTLFDILKKLNKNISIIIVSHDIGTILPTVNKIICLNETMRYHGDVKGLSEENISDTYGCPFELVGHGKIPHRIIGHH